MNAFSEELEVSGRKYPVSIIIEKRSNSRVSLGRKGITMRISAFLGMEKREKQISEFRKWAIKRMLKNPERFLPENPVIYSDSQTLTILGKNYKIHIKKKNKEKSFAKIAGDIINISLPAGVSAEEQCKITGRLIGKLLSRNMIESVKERAEAFNSSHFRANILNVRIRNNKSTWGSCSKNGEITISSRLLLAPLDVIDYVLIHEIAHLIERNHSKRFWGLVERAVPDYKEKRKWLRKNGHMIRL